MEDRIFGLPIKYEKWGKQSVLPLYVSKAYDFVNAFIANVRFIIIIPKDELVSLPTLKKQIAKIQEVDNVEIALKLSSISNYRRDAFIAENIAFITEKQIYLPFIGALLTCEQEAKKINEKFMYSTQQLFLYYLYSGQESLYLADAIKALPFSAMTASRATKQLQTSDLFSISKDGVNKILTSKYSRRELFEKAKVYLSSPVRKGGYIQKSQVKDDFVFAADTALSKKTMLNPSKVISYAVYGRKFDEALLSDELIDPSSQARLELWAYDPRQFSTDDCADILSVVLSLKDTKDERIEACVKELINKQLGK
jgi:hypothetical protein